MRIFDATDQAMREAALAGGLTEKRIYADWLEESGDGDLAAVVRTRLDHGELPEQRIWSGERRLPAPTRDVLRPVVAPLDLSVGAKLLPLVAGVARTRSRERAARDLEPWLPAAADAVSAGRIGWTPFRSAAFERYARRLERSGRRLAAAFVRRHRSEVVWAVDSLDFAADAWTLHPRLSRAGFARATPHWIDAPRVAEGVSEAARRSERWPDRPGHWSEFEAVAHAEPETRRSDALDRRWRRASEIVVRLAGEGAATLADEPAFWLKRLRLVDSTRREEFDHAIALFESRHARDDASARLESIAVIDAVRTASARWSVATSLEPTPPLEAPALLFRSRHDRASGRRFRGNRLATLTVLLWFGLLQ